jgi:anti-sigma factor RsiW
MILMAFPPDRLELVHRFFDGELSRAEQAEVEALLSSDEDARGVLRQLRSLDRSTRNELLAAGAKEDFTGWWDHVEQQMKAPSLEPPTGVEPVRRPTTVSILPGQIHAASPERRVLTGWLMTAAFTAIAVASAAGVLLMAVQ